MIYGGAVIAILTLPVFCIKIGLPSRHWWPAGTEAGDGLEALTEMGVAGFIQPVRVMVQVPPGRSVVEATSLRGLMTLTDSLRADPRVREVRGLVDARAQGHRCSGIRCSTATSTRRAPSIPTFWTPT